MNTISRNSSVGELTLSQICYCLALSIFLTYKILQMSLLAAYVDSSVSLGFNGSIVLLLALGEIMKRDAVHNVIAVIISTVFLLVFIRNTGFTTIFVAIMLIYCGKDFSFREISKVAVTVTSICAMTIVLLSYFGVLNDYLWTGASRVRHGLGFRYCTYLSHLYLNVVLLLIYVRPRTTIPGAFFLMLINYAIYDSTVSRNSFILTSLALLFALSWSYTRAPVEHCRAICRIGMFSIPAMLALSVVFLFVYNQSPSSFVNLDHALSGRLSYTSHSLATYGITPFGQAINFAANSLDPNGVLLRTTGEFDFNVVDNSFWHILIEYGFVLFAVVMICYVKLGNSALKYDDYRLALILVIIALHAVIDPQLFDLQFNTFILLFANYRYSVVDVMSNWKVHESRSEVSVDRKLKLAGRGQYD